MAKKKELIKEELKLIGKIKAYFPAGEISPEIIRAWNNCSDIMFFLKLTELFGEMPEKSLEKSRERNTEALHLSTPDGTCENCRGKGYILGIGFSACCPVCHGSGKRW